MTDLTPGSGRPVPRRRRQDRAYTLVRAGGAGAVVTAVTLVLALVNVIGFTLPLLALIFTVVCVVLFRRTVSGR